MAACMVFVFGSCKDDDGNGVSMDTIVGVWEGIDADYWSTNPNNPQDDNWWLTETEKDQEEYGEDISDYRVEFTSDQFYRVYRYDQYNDKWYTTGSNGKWKVEGNTLTMMAYNSSDDKYDEETPEVYQILELSGTKITLEYHKKTSAGETYRKVTFRQIASKEDMADEQKGDDSSSPVISGSVPTGHPAEFVGTWIGDNVEGYLILKSDGSGYSYDPDYDESEEHEAKIDDYRWGVGDNQFWIDYRDGDGYAIFKVKSITSEEMILEFTGTMYTEEGELDNSYSDEKGAIQHFYKVK